VTSRKCRDDISPYQAVPAPPPAVPGTGTAG